MPPGITLLAAEAAFGGAVEAHRQVANEHCPGSDEERARIRRRAHAVRGHLRRLAPGRHASPQAKELAQQFGIAVPDGFTFVRPHVRGKKRTARAPAEVVVKAKGLASVTTLLVCCE